MATHSSILAWEIPWTEDPGRVTWGPWGHKELADAGDTEFNPCRADPLEKEMTTHSCILAWEIPWTEEPGRL